MGPMSYFSTFLTHQNHCFFYKLAEELEVDEEDEMQFVNEIKPGTNFLVHIPTSS